ncbi:MAG: hypothetical protein A3G87_06835 [Omnitrophica bacterium RIFCSPLOWO2_12_FULL_50_11]|nr:MAG: hypothetical protein A3G87_06835 [Omnitrophica bacterium RIFCSPLOWO2_12_FULL_50_11]
MINWRNCIFFFTVTAVAVIGVPVYIYVNGISAVEIGLFVFGTLATGLSITVGYHRLFAHRSFQASPIVHFLTLFFGAGAFQESVLQWASQHRQHHAFVDTERDPYNIKQGFFYAHMGWLLFRKHKIDYDNVKDLEKNRLVQHQHKHYVLWSVVSGLILPTFMGALMDHALGAFLIGVAGRITFVHHGTFMINSVCHWFGRPTYNDQESPRDHWLIALITMGEGYHSFHHRFPSDYRNGVKWYHWDPSKWVIRMMSFVGLAKGLKRASEFQILSATLVAEKESVEGLIARVTQKFSPAALETLKTHYDRIKFLLHQWEQRVKEHAEICGRGLRKSHELRRKALQRVQEARRQFLRVREEWSRFVVQPAIYA